MPERTEDGHHILVDGRRWRATDPSIPEKLAAELVAALMQARRDVGRGEDVPDARRRVQQAKVALGERGEPWWEPTQHGRRSRLEAAISALAEHRGPDRTLCPSDAARAVGGSSWRPLMETARDVARDLARRGEVTVTQKGAALDPDVPWKGPVRIRTTR